MNLRNVLFWDTDPTQLDFESHASLVIERVASLGTLEEWHQVLQYYGEERIKREVCQLRYLDKKTMSYLAARFNIPKEEFRCYTLQQSTQTHYPY